ncbi:MAG: hypothetical protein OM95_03055 [Bdellovibrio sp. ArHS]|uniref:hypothetical protein n=1 Tax=Bdellovibrio sp. ArHS TaxID=1569284 RepID=UPI00058376DD|nr:hypothetical protein [Bdellovibrio sp. ArHS]KHD89368.1 MAG: hypothetical protein OM95_03055 [Bdellovibrio sp. ArHS]
MKKFFVLAALLVICGCATQKKETANWDEFHDLKSSSADKTKKAEKKTSETTSKPGGIVVDGQDVQTLEKMTKAVELFVLKNQKADFARMCKDKRFDCFVDEKPFPKAKKIVKRTVPPYASGSKMGLQGEKRVQVKYDFYP